MGVIGGSVVLPCSAREPQHKTEDIIVNWKNSDRLNVYAISNGKGSVEGQDPKYKKRAESFPEQYLRGNFSLKLNDLQLTDAGKYQCYIIEELTIKTVELHIEGLWGGKVMKFEFKIQVTKNLLLLVSYFENLL